MSALFRRIAQELGCLASKHSQTRITLQPSARSRRSTCLSRRLFRRIFSRQSLAFDLGVKFLPQSCPCQKQPSTNTATRSPSQAKSGRPVNGRWRLHPRMPASRSSEAIRNSVLELARPRTLAISSDLLSRPNPLGLRFELPGHVDTLRLSRPEGSPAHPCEDRSEAARKGVADHLTGVLLRR